MRPPRSLGPLAPERRAERRRFSARSTQATGLFDCYPDIVRFLAAVISLSLAFGPLAQRAAAAGQMVRMAAPGQTLNVPVAPLTTPGSTVAGGLTSASASISLDSALPTARNGSITPARGPAAAIGRTPAAAAPSAVNAPVRTTPLIGGNSVRRFASSDQESEKGNDDAIVSRETENGVPSAEDKTRNAPDNGRIEETLETVRTGQETGLADTIDEAPIEEAKGKADELFDGATKRGESEASPVAASSKEGKTRAPLLRRLARATIGRLLPSRLGARRGRSPPAPKVSYRHLFEDEYGGPKKQDLSPPPGKGRVRSMLSSLGRHAGYGLKWGVNMLGIVSLMSITLKPLLSMIPWQLHVNDLTLLGLGRIEILTDMGPHLIAQAAAQSPLGFLFVGLPIMVGIEEVVYRMLWFGLPFLALAALKPVAKRILPILDELPELFGLTGMLKWGVTKIAGLSGRSYALAGGLSSFVFAAAHIAAWGFSPFTFLTHLVLGSVLVRTAYRSRGLIAPFVAHLSFNMATIAIGALLPLYLAAGTSAIVTSIAAVASLAFLWYNYRVHRKERKAAIAEAKGQAYRPRTRGLWRRLLIGGMIMSLLYGGMSITGGPAVPAYQPAPTSISFVQKNQPIIPGLPNIHAPAVGPVAPKPAAPQLSAQQIVQQVKQGVVMVRTRSGMGTGFIVDANGFLVTNAHVVSKHMLGGVRMSREHVGTVMIRFQNGREFPGRVVGYNPDKDLAIIQLPMNPFGWPTVPIGDSTALQEGEDILAMGHPRGLPFSVTRGIVSGLQFRNNGYVTYIQHDASVNPGNSGGPLFNMRGEVVGVNSMIITMSGGFDGISYAITAADLKEALAQFATTGNISTAWMGAIFYPSSPDAPSFGAWVELVRPGSPAEAAGLRAGDVVVGVDGHRLANNPKQAAAQLAAILRAKKPTDTITLQVARDGQAETVNVTLGGR